MSEEFYFESKNQESHPTTDFVTKQIDSSEEKEARNYTKKLQLI